MNGSTAVVGDHNDVRNEHRQSVSPADETQRRLLAEVVDLRADLARLRRTDGVEVLDAELVEVEEEIATTGAVGPTRLARLRGALTTAEGITGMFASGAAVAETVHALLGG